MAQDMTPRKDNWYAPPAPPAPPAAPSGRTDGGYTRPAGPAPSPARSSHIIPEKSEKVNKNAFLFAGDMVK